MLRGTPEHAKTAALAARLGITIYAAVGLLEMMWHFTSRSARQGDIGRWSDEVIATACHWDREPSELVTALTEVGWLDEVREHRLVVHDWHEHADRTTKRALERSGQKFLSTASATRKRGKPSRPTIYILSEAGTGRLKIGFVEGPLQARIDALQTGNPAPLELVVAFEGTRADEAKLHERFASARIAGEWFLPKKELLDFIAEVVKTTNPNADRDLRCPPAGSQLTATRRTPGASPVPEPEPAPEPVPEPEPVVEATTTTERARGAVENSSPAPAAEDLDRLAIAEPIRRLGRLIAQLESVDRALASELEAAIEDADGSLAPEDLERLADRALDRLTAPENAQGRATA